MNKSQPELISRDVQESVQDAHFYWGLPAQWQARASGPRLVPLKNAAALALLRAPL